MSKLFSTFNLRDIKLSNRIVISPMCQYSADGGKATDWHMIHLGSLALSGAGMLCIEATAVEKEGRITFGDLGLWDDVTMSALEKIVSVVKRYSDIPVSIQLSHAGRKASCHRPWESGRQLTESDGRWQTLAPSAIALNPSELPPIALTFEAIERIKEAFKNATIRANKIGIDGIEIHAAHGYLLHQFLSPISNVREDKYGGSLENRMRFPLEVFDIVRSNFPQNKPVGVRVSATDWIENGWDLKDTIEFSKELKIRNVDWIDVSTGGLSPLQVIKPRPSYQVEFSEALKKEVNVNTITVGLITETKQAEEIISSGKADLVALARGMLFNPRWPWHAAAELGDSISVPNQYARSAPYEHKNLFNK